MIGLSLHVLMTSLVLLLMTATPRARADVIVLQDLLNGQSFRTGNYLLENFRNYGPAIPGLGSGLIANPANILVTSTATGLTLTGPGKTLVSINGQGPISGQFTFDVVPIAPATSINLIGIDVIGSLDPFFGNGMNVGVFPFLDGSLNVTGTVSPLGLVAGEQNRGTTTSGGEFGAGAFIPGTPSLTVTAAFYASGLTLHSVNSHAEIDSVAIVFVPEPPPMALAGIAMTLTAALAWCQHRRSQVPVG